MINIIKCDYVQWVDYAYHKILGRVGCETDYVNLDPKQVFVQDGLMEHRNTGKDKNRWPKLASVQEIFRLNDNYTVCGGNSGKSVSELMFLICYTSKIKFFCSLATVPRTTFYC